MSDTSIIVLTLFVTPSGSLSLNPNANSFLLVLRSLLFLSCSLQLQLHTLLLNSLCSCALAADALREPPPRDGRGAPRGAHTLHAQLLRLRVRVITDEHPDPSACSLLCSPTPVFFLRLSCLPFIAAHCIIDTCAIPLITAVLLFLFTYSFLPTYLLTLSFVLLLIFHVNRELCLSFLL